MRSEPITPSTTSRYQMSPKLPLSPLHSFSFDGYSFPVTKIQHVALKLRTMTRRPSRHPWNMCILSLWAPPGPLHCISREYTSGGSQSLRCGPSSTHAHTSRAPASAVGKVPVGATRGALPIQFVLTPVLEAKTIFFEYKISSDYGFGSGNAMCPIKATVKPCQFRSKY